MPFGKKIDSAKPRFVSNALNARQEARSGQNSQLNSRYPTKVKRASTAASRGEEEKEDAAPMGKLFQFDPSNMSKGDIVNIAENADNLIKIISNIKH